MNKNPNQFSPIAISYPITSLQVVEKMWSLSKDFFNLPAEDKENCKVKSWRDVGYYNNPGVKQFWQVRKA